MAELTATTPIKPPAPRLTAFARTVAGVTAIGVKELRGRMRGRRAFVILTIYLALLGGFALMVERIMEAQFNDPFSVTPATASPAIGQGIFAALLLLMTLQVVFLAPSSTAGAISLEREKQTLDLLVTTPISAFAIVIGKLLSALIYVFLLIAASIPLMAVVFVFGGVGPDDVVRGYVVLLVSAIGLGAFGLLCSSLVKRTTAATAITIFGVLAITIGTIFVLVFWQAMSGFDDFGRRRDGPLGIRTPTPLAWINPFVAQADVLCGTESSLGGGWCSFTNGLVPADNGVIIRDGGVVPVPAPPVPGVVGGGVRIAEPAVEGGFVGGGGAPDDVVAVQFGPIRDRLWTGTVATWLVLTAIFVFLSVQAVSPTRRWTLRRERRPSAETST
jgi:ABC-type transport system involved in multi-copper enzyme maturation permease subunit